MNLPKELSSDSQMLLGKLHFTLSESNDGGMTKSFAWKNNFMKLALIYDRGYYELYISAEKKPFEDLSLIKLLRFLKNDASFFQNELIKANLAYTLSIDDYIYLLYSNYDLVKEFIQDYNQEAFDRFDKFEVFYNGI